MNNEINLNEETYLKMLTLYKPNREYNLSLFNIQPTRIVMPRQVTRKKKSLIPSLLDENRDSKTTDEVSQCKVCNDNRSICLMRPCKHLCMCVHCTRIKFSIDNKCIICRIKVEEIDVLFQ